VRSPLAANEEYYQLLRINDSLPSGLDVSSYTIEEIDSITSEYTLKNNVSAPTAAESQGAECQPFPLALWKMCPIMTCSGVSILTYIHLYIYV